MVRLFDEVERMFSEYAFSSREVLDIEKLRVRLQSVATVILGLFCFIMWASSLVVVIPWSFTYRHLMTWIFCIALYFLAKTSHYKTFFRLSFTLGTVTTLYRSITTLNSGEYFEFYPVFAGHLVSALVGTSFLLPVQDVLAVAVTYILGTFSFFYLCPTVPVNIIRLIFHGVLMSVVPCICYFALARLMQQIIFKQAQALGRARDVALEASKLKSQFVATMSHEIRTPLNGVIGLTEMLLRTQLNNDQRHWVENVQTSGRVLLSLANQVLDFSRIEAGKLELRKDEINIRSVIEDVVQVCGATTQLGVDMISYVDPQLPEIVIGDDTRLQQIIVNLVGNATKFTHEGQVEVHAELVNNDSGCFEMLKRYSTADLPAINLEKSVFVRISVRDSGIGMTQTQVARLFQPFTQADSSTTRKYGGSGLGLVISQRLAELMQGEIQVKSENGVGSEFSTVLRFDASAYLTPVTVVEPLLAREKIVIISAKERLGRCYQDFLTAHGALCSVVPAVEVSTKDVLVARVRKLKPAVVVIDSPLLTLLIGSLLRELSCGFVIMMNREQVISSSDLSHTTYIRKPYRGQVLLDAVCAQLSRPLTTAVSRLPSADQLLGETTVVKGSRILLAEDYLVNQMVMKLMLGKLGCEVDVADDGAIALEKYRESLLSGRPYSVILMDMQMPVMDGLESTKAIRAIEESECTVPRHIPIIAVTASALSDDSQWCLRNGMDAFISKPVSLHTLTNALVHWVSLKSAESST